MSYKSEIRFGIWLQNLNKNYLIKTGGVSFKTFLPVTWLKVWGRNFLLRYQVSNNPERRSPLGGSVAGFFFPLSTVTSLWNKQRLSKVASQGEICSTINCGFSLKYFRLTVWKECKGPHLFHSLGPKLSRLIFVLFLCLVSLSTEPSIITTKCTMERIQDSFRTWTEPSNHNKTFTISIRVSVLLFMRLICFNS